MPVAAPPLSIAGLPESSARVKVGPPLFCKGPSSGLIGEVGVPIWSPIVDVIIAPELLPIRSYPRDVSPPLTSIAPLAALFKATMVFLALVAIPDSLKMPPPPALPAELRAIVLLVRVKLLPLPMPPPPLLVELSEIVLLVIVAVLEPRLLMPPPLVAVLPETVLLVTVKVAALLIPPPPDPPLAELPEIVLLSTVAVPEPLQMAPPPMLPLE